MRQQQLQVNVVEAVSPALVYNQAQPAAAQAQQAQQAQTQTQQSHHHHAQSQTNQDQTSQEQALQSGQPQAYACLSLPEKMNLDFASKITEIFGFNSAGESVLLEVRSQENENSFRSVSHSVSVRASNAIEDSRATDQDAEGEGEAEGEVVDGATQQKPVPVPAPPVVRAAAYSPGYVPGRPREVCDM